MNEVTGPIIAHHPGADGRVRAGSVPGRDHRTALPAIRADDRGHGHHQRDQRPDAQARAVGRVSAPHHGKRKNFFFRGFNWVYCRFEAVYVWIVRRLVRVSPLVMLLYVGLVAAHGLALPEAADWFLTDRGPRIRHLDRAAS